MRIENRETGKKCRLNSLVRRQCEAWLVSKIYVWEMMKEKVRHIRRC